MPELFSYLLKASLIWLLFYTGYMLLLRKDTHFHWRRAYLLIIIACALIVPILPQPAITSFETIEPIQIQSFDITSTVPLERLEAIEEAATAWTLMEVLGLIYAIGFGCMLIRLLVIGSHVFNMYYTAHYKQVDGIKVAFSHLAHIPFSFFNTIFYPKTASEQQLAPSILAHESAHIRQKHSLDIVLFELILLFFWFLPIAWLHKKALREVHEYLADAAVLKNGFDRKSYQHLVLGYSVGAQKLALANAFNHLSTFKRIKMMNTRKNSNVTKLKYAAIIPIATLCMFFFAKANPSVPASMNMTSPTIGGILLEGIVYDANDKSPLIGATITVKGSKLGTITSFNGVFKLDVPSDEPTTLEVRYKGKTTYEITVVGSGTLDIYLGDELQSTSHRFIAKKSENTFEFKDRNPVIRLNKDGGASIDNEKMDPLYILDGKVLEKGAYEEIDPNTIKSINVIKNESAVFKYGEKGKDGVVEIFLKDKSEASGNTFVKEKDAIRIENNQEGRQIKIRSNSGDGDLQPLIVVDGKVMKRGTIKDIDPETIESVNVLKGEAARKKYGDDGKNGVVQIVLKGKAEKSSNRFDEKKYQDKEKGSMEQGATRLENIFETNSTNGKVIIKSNSVGKSGQPIYIVDGHVVKEGQDLELDPEDIDVIEVIKTEAATAIYGERAKNGAVIIKTKK